VGARLVPTDVSTLFGLLPDGAESNRNDASLSIHPHSINSLQLVVEIKRRIPMSDA
jgi:hypothetical protein